MFICIFISFRQAFGENPPLPLYFKAPPFSPAARVASEHGVPPRHGARGAPRVAAPRGPRQVHFARLKDGTEVRELQPSPIQRHAAPFGQVRFKAGKGDKEHYMPNKS